MSKANFNKTFDWEFGPGVMSMVAGECSAHGQVAYFAEPAATKVCPLCDKERKSSRSAGGAVKTGTGTTEGDSQLVFTDIRLAKIKDDAVPRPLTKGQKHDNGKPRWDLMPWRAAGEVVNVLTFGAEKYGDHNWQHVPEGKARYTSAAMRHLTAWTRGEINDSESGYHHLAHAATCLFFLLETELLLATNEDRQA